MLLNWLNKEFAGATAWTVKLAQAPMERGREAEQPN